MRRASLLFAGWLCALLAGCIAAHRPSARESTLIVISIDAFRWDYLERYHPPTLTALARDGVRVNRLEACFPTKTFPNHYTLVTGLRPEHHGMVSNFFHDPDLDASFSKNRPADNADARWWAGGEPVWITAEKSGLRAGCCLWPGDEAELQGRRPSFLRRYEKGISSAARVETLLEWLAQPAGQRPRLAALYFEAVDNAGHKHGPDSPEVAAAIADVDQAIAQLMAGLDRLGLRAQTNVVVVSDHGMAATDTAHVVFLEDLMDTRHVQVESTGANGGVRPTEGTPGELVAEIRRRAPPQLHAYLRAEVPAEFHYRASPRIPPIVLIADLPWMIESKVGWPKFSANYDRGNHGWDPRAPEMGAFLVANGPAFRSGATVAVAQNVDVYNLLCATLGLTPAPNDGGRALARAALR